MGTRRQSLGAKARLVIPSGLGRLSEEDTSGGGGKMAALPESNDVSKLEELLKARDSTLSAIKRVLEEAIGRSEGDGMDEDGLSVLSMTEKLVQDYQARLSAPAPEFGDIDGKMGQECVQDTAEIDALKEMLEASKAEVAVLKTQLKEQEPPTEVDGMVSAEEVRQLRSRLGVEGCRSR